RPAAATLPASVRAEDAPAPNQNLRAPFGISPQKPVADQHPGLPTMRAAHELDREQHGGERRLVSHEMGQSERCCHRPAAVTDLRPKVKIPAAPPRIQAPRSRCSPPAARGCHPEHPPTPTATGGRFSTPPLPKPAVPARSPTPGQAPTGNAKAQSLGRVGPGRG